MRGAAPLSGCDHKTVAYWVRQRELAGGLPVVERKRPAMEAVLAAKIDELVDRSHGEIRADVAHGRLVAQGYEGSPLMTRRWVAGSKRRWRQRHGRRARPWIPEPGRGCRCEGRPSNRQRRLLLLARHGARLTS
jgi:hypothetical protein